VDATGTLYIADSFTHTIRKITKAGVASTLAGQPSKPGYANGSGAAALFEEPRGIAVDASGTVYVADQINRAIRKITPAGIVTTLADTTRLRTAAGIDSVIHFFMPTGVAVNAAGTVYVADESGVIYRVSPMGVISVLAGKIGERGSTDGSGSAARFNRPGGLAVDKDGNLYMADSFNRTIRKITPAGAVTTLAGLGGDGNATRTGGGSENDPTGGTDGSTDGPGAVARFSYPTGVAVDAAGTVYVADIGNHTIRVISPMGIVYTLAGKTKHEGRSNGSGSTARFKRPIGIAVDTKGIVYVADEENGSIRVIK
jgi:sugar lactone lactonase YvrE